MDYYYAKTLANTTLDAPVTCASEVVQEHGCGVLAETDVTATTKQKLDLCFPSYPSQAQINPGAHGPRGSDARKGRPGSSP